RGRPRRAPRAAVGDTGRGDARPPPPQAGALPRPPRLTDAFIRQSRGEAVDDAELTILIADATAKAIAAQRDAGIDVANDGEQSRESFFTYVRHRLTGFGGESDRPIMRDLIRYPGFVTRKLPELSRPMVSLLRAPQAIGPVRHAGTASAAAEVERYLDAVAAAGARFAECFLTAPSPGIVACAIQNVYYPDPGQYLAALAAALRPEYETVVQHGLVLQVDAPDLAMERHTRFADRPLEEFLAFVDQVIDALNGALAGCRPDRVRL